jgi:hypothetical protein
MSIPELWLLKVHVSTRQPHQGLLLSKISSWSAYRVARHKVAAARLPPMLGCSMGKGATAVVVLTFLSARR